MRRRELNAHEVVFRGEDLRPSLYEFDFVEVCAEGGVEVSSEHLETLV